MQTLAVVVRIGLVLGIILFSVLILLFLKSTKVTSERNIDNGAPLVVRAMVAEHRDVDRVWEGYGTVRTMIASDIVAEVSGRVVARPADIEPGERVRAGDLIVQLDDSDYANAYEAAKQSSDSLLAQIDGLTVESERIGAQIEYAGDEIGAAQRDLERTENAIAQGAGSPGERDVKLQSLRRLQREQLGLKQQLELIPSRRAQLMAQLASQRANARIAKENQTRAKIISPLAGELNSVALRVGDWAGNGMVVARVVDLSRLEVPLRLPASSSSWVKIGDDVSLWVGDADTEPVQTGRIVRIAPEADSSSRTITVFVEVSQDASDRGRLLSGQFVLGRVRTPDPDRRMVVPRRVVQDGFVLVAQDDGDEESLSINRVPVRSVYGFEGVLEGADPLESQWLALDLGHEPESGVAVVLSLLDQLEVGMRVVVQGDAGDGEDAEGSP